MLNLYKPSLHNLSNNFIWAASLLVLSPAKISEKLGSPLCLNFWWCDICDCNSPQNSHGLLPANIADTSDLSLGLSFMCLQYSTVQTRLFNLCWCIWMLIIGCGRIWTVFAWERATVIWCHCSWFPWLLLIHCWKPWAVRSGWKVSCMRFHWVWFLGLFIIYWGKIGALKAGGRIGNIRYHWGWVPWLLIIH